MIGLMRRGRAPALYATHQHHCSGTLIKGVRATTATKVNTAYVIAVITSLNFWVEVLCFRAVEPDSTGARAYTYPTSNDCIAALKRLAKAQHDNMHQMDLRCVSEKSALPYIARESK